MLNKIVVMGRLTRDPELRYTSSQTAVATFTLAVDRDYTGRDGTEKQTDYIDCVAWRGSAEYVSKYFFKGSMAVVSGRLQLRYWEDKEGNKRKIFEVVADTVYFGETKKESYDWQTSPPDVSGPAAPAPFAELSEDEGELPF